MNQQKRCRPISRRTILGGAGAAIGLPFLEAMWPGNAHAAVQAKSPRYVALFFANGAYLPQWVPTEIGPLTKLPPLLTPAEPIKKDLLVVSGLDNKPAHPNYPNESGGGDHATGVASMLSCAPCILGKTTCGITIDQVIANHYKTTLNSALPSMQLGLSTGSATDKGFSAVYSANMSWSNDTTWLPKVTDPAAVFDLLFAGFDPSVSAADAAARRALRKSVLDEVKSSATSIWQRLGTTDRHRLDQWFTGIRQLERSIDAGGTASCGKVSKPAGGTMAFQDLAPVMLDLMAKALICDRTRVMTMLLDNGFSGRSYAFLPGGGGNHHGLSHHGRVAYTQTRIGDYFRLSDAMRPAKLTDFAGVDVVAGYEVITQWQVTQFTKLAQALQAAVEPDGKTVLDNTIMFMSSDASDGDRHWHEEMPVLMAGSGGGAIKPGRHVRFDRGGFADLHLACAKACGVPIDKFGVNSTSPLSLV